MLWSSIGCRVCGGPVDGNEMCEINMMSGSEASAIHQRCKYVEELRGMEKFAAFIRRGYCDCDSCTRGRQRMTHVS